MAFQGFRSAASDVSANWRTPRATTEAQQQQQMVYSYQMALQALNQQTMEMQERLMAQMQQTTAAMELNDEPSEEEMEAGRQRRSAALSNLQRAQQNRTSPEPEGPARPRSANRLSFNGTENFLEQAVARRTAQSPPEQAHFVRGHQRSASSTSSSRSVMLSEQHKRMMSPSTGLTLVLSQPGDSFPSPTLGRSNRPLVVNTASAADSDSANSSPRTPQSEDNSSEVYSFESMTSVHTEDGKDTASFLTRLNPSAPSFTPVPGPPTRHASAPQLQIASPIVKAIRQPKGPCPEEQLPALNFAGRVRARAFNQMRSRLRATSPVVATFSL